MASDRHIIIDGWNAVRSNRSTERTFLEHGLDAAREVFWKLVEPLHDYAGSRVTIVYDGKGEEISIQRRNGINTLSEVFTPSYMTADELIEQLCATSSNPSSITVVTRDNLLRLTSTTFGATALSPDKLFDSAGGCAKAMAGVPAFVQFEGRPQMAERKRIFRARLPRLGNSSRRKACRNNVKAYEKTPQASFGAGGTGCRFCGRRG